MLFRSANGDYLADERNGRWQQARRVPGIPAPPTDVSEGSGGQQAGVTAISCTTGGFCGAAGVYYTGHDYVEYDAAFLATKAALVPTTTALTVRPAKVTYGREQAAKLTVRVAPRLRGTATGKVTVAIGKTTICVITLKSGAGTCALGPKRLGPGGYAVIARYGGNGPFTGSVSGQQKLTVVK